MMTCQRETGRQFLAGQLQEVQEAAFADHVESCRQCRQWLEQDAGDDLSWRLAEELGVQECPPCDASCDPASRPADEATAPQISLDQASKQIRPYLAPSDDPSMMGRVGPYEIAGIIGRGGMGIVLKAFERSLNRNVAIKLLDPTLANTGSARVRFAREAKAMAAVSHAHVVPIFAVDQHQQLPYFAMEYVVGETLEHRLRRDGPLDLASIVRVALQISEALAAAHARGLVHRDIKPGNILLDRGTERVRVADFGLARIASDVSQTHSAFIAGTPRYMSPEQVRGETCDHRSDLFSLGSVMYAMGTGHAPFRADTLYGTMQRIAHDRPHSIRDQNPEVPPWLENLIFRLLGKVPSERFESAEAVATILRNELSYLLNPTQVMKPLRPWEKAYRSRSRSRLRWTAYSATVVSLLLIGVLIAPHVTSPTDVSSGSLDPPSSVSDANHDTTGTKATASDVVTDQSVPLWDIDGTQQALQRANSLEANLRSGPSSHDLWQPELDLIRGRLTDLSQEPF